MVTLSSHQLNMLKSSPSSSKGDDFLGLRIWRLESSVLFAVGRGEDQEFNFSDILFIMIRLRSPVEGGRDCTGIARCWMFLGSLRMRPSTCCCSSNICSESSYNWDWSRAILQRSGGSLS
ncbi:hypothetical protein Droror1_Dr00007430 [Drosera rotundifolia]